MVADEEMRTRSEVAEHLKEMAVRFERAGAQIRELRMPRPMSELPATRGTVCEVEASDLHAHLLRERPEGCAPGIK